MNTVSKPSIQSNAGYGSQKSQYNTRIETSADPVVNKRLFQIYEVLIPPVQDIENAVKHIESHKEKITQLENHNFIPKFLDLVIKVALFLIIAFTISPLADDIINSFSGRYNGLISFFVGLLGTLLFYLFVLFIAYIAGEVIHNMINKALSPQKQPEINNEKAEITSLQQQIQTTVNNIKHAIAFVPPAYRTSDALSYFVKAYHNSRVDNLKEAVNAYEMHLEAEHTRSLLHQQIEALTNIQFQNAIMIDQLDSLRSDVWFSNVIYW